MRIIEGNLVAEGLKVGIVVGRFNEFIVSKLLGGALDGLKRHGVEENNIDVAWVPGAFEIPLVAKKMAKNDEYDVVICLGAVIKGSTPHFDYDGTLHNSIKIYKPAFMKAYDYLVANGYAKKREFEEEEISKFLGLSPKDMWNTFMPNLPKCEKEKCSSIIGQAMIEYIDKGEVQLYDCTIETLNKLNEYGYKLIFLSNCKSSYMNKHIEKFNLNKYFIDFYCSEDFHFIPKYEIFKFIKENYQGDFIVVGDRFVDIELAKKHNLFSIGCSYGYGNYDELKEADYIIENIKDIIHILGI